MKPGDSLHRLLDGLGFTITPECQCQRHIVEMNHRGKAWCQANLDTILGWLETEAKNRGLSFPRKMAKGLVRVALWRSSDN